jgi:hypothetical protein
LPLADAQKPVMMVVLSSQLLPASVSPSPTLATSVQTPMTQITGFALTPQGQQLVLTMTAPESMAKNLLPGTIMTTAVPTDVIETNLVQMKSGEVQTTRPPVQTMPFHPALGETWESLETLWHELRSGTMPMAQDLAPMLRQAIPSANPQQFTPALLFFMALIKHNFDVPWSNEKIATTHPLAKKSGLLAQIAGDLQAVRNAMTSDTGSVDSWRPLPLPFQMGEQLLRLQCFYRHHYDESDSKEDDRDEEARRKKRKTRFIMDVPQTRLGNVQIDGLVQPRQLDVILRTEASLDMHQRAAIGQRFQGALEINGFFGELSFQIGTENYVRV